MISWELDPFHTRGGTAYAIRRLADQLTGLGIETSVLLPDCLDTHPGNNVAPLLKPVLLKMPANIDRATRGVQCSEFSRAALEAMDQVGTDVVIAHSLEGAMFIVQSAKRFYGPSVFWLHSLYDPPLSDLSKDDQLLMPLRSLLASAVTLADVVVTSAGILQDAREIEWPEQLKELQTALLAASTEGRVLTVESMGCLPHDAQDMQPQTIESLKDLKPYILFPGRPSVDKGLGIFAAIATRLQDDDITCVAVRRPANAAEIPFPRKPVKFLNPFHPCSSVAKFSAPAHAPIHWLPWLKRAELVSAMRNSACTVLPSITEGFGLAAAESISQGVRTLYQDVGGHRSLHSLPGAFPVPLTTAERAQLYRLWAELFASRDYWSVWESHEKSFSSLIDRWVEAIKSVVFDAREFSQNSQVAAEDQWGYKLLQRLELRSDSASLCVSAVTSL